MRILIASSCPPDARSGGIISYCRELIHALTQRGHEIHWASPLPAQKLLESNGRVTHVFTDAYADPIENAHELYRYHKENSIDGSINNDNPVLQSIAPALGTPVVAVSHSPVRVIASLAVFQHQWIDHVVAISSDMQRRLVLRHGVPAYKCPILFNAVADPGHDGIFDSQDENSIVVCFVGGSLRNKGADLIQKLVSRPAGDWEGMTFRWFGNTADKLKDCCGDRPFLELCGQVSREKLLSTLARSDVMLVPSRAEGCPMALIEGMSCGLAIITSDGVGAMREMVAHGENGFVCNLKDWTSQAMQCLRYLRDNPSVLCSMKERSRDRFLSVLESSHLADRIVELLQRPTVNRRCRPHELRILRWHRWPDPSRSSLMDKVRFRTGYLAMAGTMSVQQ